MFWVRLGNQVWAKNLALNPQPGLQILEPFSGPHSYKFFVAFPGNATNNSEKIFPEWDPEKVPESAGLVGDGLAVL